MKARCPHLFSRSLPGRPVRRRALLLLGALAAGGAFRASAICPHEVLVLANGNSLDSVLVARSFVRQRGIPEQNLVRLNLPEAVWKGVEPLAHEDFTRLVWEPANRAAEERGLSRHILAWVYSTDFPYRVATLPELSLTGLTFLRNRLPEDLPRALGDAAEGEPREANPLLLMYASPLFLGPLSEKEALPDSKTFDRLRAAVLDDMPLPAMFLGWTGTRGNTVEEVLECLKRGHASDGSRPEGTYYFPVNRDVRSQSRQWQYPAAIQALDALGGKGYMPEAFPEAGRACGLLSGVRTLPPVGGLEFLPGAYADHFTSFAAAFHEGGQSKLTSWIRQGATASSGTVTEPYAYWPKFPGAVLFLHQRRGCSMIEAIYLATRCPLQLLPVGDPLANPWGETLAVTIDPPPPGPLPPVFQAHASVDRGLNVRFDWLLDGRLVGSGASHGIDTASLPPGPHRLRAVARTRGDVRANGFAEVTLEK